ncbi:MAG TPA: hypothetical protein VE135_02510 [Pyrinomonadaceae bacterium]|nr:hypothetical protein [Pyrinomonadaceae bacterium]
MSDIPLVLDTKKSGAVASVAEDGQVEPAEHRRVGNHVDLDDFPARYLVS